MILLIFVSALSIAAVAAWFSIFGIMAIYAGLKTPALIMGIVIELGKLVSVSWLYRNWTLAPLKLRLPMLFLTIVVMFITSMGTFGFLSKAHIEQGESSGNNTAKIERIDQRIAVEQKKIDDSLKMVAQLDDSVDAYIKKNRIAQSVALRKSQDNQRKQLKQLEADAQQQIDVYTDQKFELQSQIRGYELEVGPIKYIAALVFDHPENNIEATVQIVTVIIVIVLDPFAILLLIAANFSLSRYVNGTEKEVRGIAISRSDVGCEKPEFETPTDTDNEIKESEQMDSVGDVQESSEISLPVQEKINEEEKTNASKKIISPRMPRSSCKPESPTNHKTEDRQETVPQLGISVSGSEMPEVQADKAIQEYTHFSSSVGNYFNRKQGFIVHTVKTKSTLPTTLGWLGPTKDKK